MKVLYRPPRCGLDESLKELKEFDTVESLYQWLRKYIFDVFNIKVFAYHDIYFSYYAYDDRIDWHTYCVIFDKAIIGFITFKYN